MIFMKYYSQKIIIFIDDSGVMHINDEYVLYGGVFFKSDESYETFKKNYINIKKNNKKELKFSKDKYKIKNIMNFLIKQNTFVVIIKNKNINEKIINDKKSRGRLKDYAQRIIIKKIVLYLITNKKINSENTTHINIYIDESNIKSNAYRIYSKDIYKELKKGIYNKKYNINFKPILTSNLKVEVKYINSKESTGIEASDLVVGYVRKNMLKKNLYKEIKIIKKII